MCIKIVTDSSADITALQDVPFEAAPLKIITLEKEYIDDVKLDVNNMVEELKSYKGKSSTSCPNPEDWITSFGDAERVICITITGTLSGSYNAACTAKHLYEEMYPEREVFVFDSLSTGPEMHLLIEKVKELILAQKEFKEICGELTAYSQNTGLIFMLESMNNLANNGRVKPLVAKLAGIMGIRLVGKASERGDLEPLKKCRGAKKALEAIVEFMREFGFNNGMVRIAHCMNEEAGIELEKMIKSAFPHSKSEVYACRGLCSFYAEKGGLLVGFEKEICRVEK